MKCKDSLPIRRSSRHRSRALRRSCFTRPRWRATRTRASPETFDDALADKKQRVVGIVINAVDDHLDKGDQIDAIWTMQHIRVLEPILAEAGAAGRLVVLLSDHGHILDRQTECREATDGLRWRRPGGTVTKDELEVSSPRVVLPDGGRVIVPWSERLRYGAKKNGYHGGVTPQEMLIPISILWPELDVPGRSWGTARRTSVVVDRTHGGSARGDRG